MQRGKKCVIIYLQFNYLLNQKFYFFTMHVFYMLFDLKTKDSGYMVYKCSVGWFSKGISLFRNIMADFNFWFLVYYDVFRISSKEWTCNTYVSVWMYIYQVSSIGLLTTIIMWIYIYIYIYIYTHTHTYKHIYISLWLCGSQ